MEKFYTMENLAELFQVSTRTIMREKLAGRLPFLMIRGRVRFRERDVRAYLDAMLADQGAAEAAPPAAQSQR